MDLEHVRYEREGGIATFTLDRPERLNALTFDSYRELTEAFRALREDEDLRCVVITGAGRAFCSGGDVLDIIGRLFGVSDEELLAFTRMTCDLIENIRLLEVPVIASLNGTTCGAGAVIAAACDIRLASEEAKIAFLFTQVGLSGADMGAGWLLPRIVGMGHASELLMVGDFISAARAAEIGLYNRVVPGDELGALTAEWAAKLAAGPSMGLAVTKRMLNEEASMGLAEAMQREAEVQAECMRHPDYREAYEAFKEKRPKDFTKYKRDGSEV